MNFWKMFRRIFLPTVIPEMFYMKMVVLFKRTVLFYTRLWFYIFPSPFLPSFLPFTSLVFSFFSHLVLPRYLRLFIDFVRSHSKRTSLYFLSANSGSFLSQLILPIIYFFFSLFTQLPFIGELVCIDLKRRNVYPISLPPFPLFPSLSFPLSFSRIIEIRIVLHAILSCIPTQISLLREPI